MQEKPISHLIFVKIKRFQSCVLKPDPRHKKLEMSWWRKFSRTIPFMLTKKADIPVDGALENKGYVIWIMQRN